MNAITKSNQHIDRELVRRTVAQGATDDELELYLYDCFRRNIHPLDKLLHFTKRGGRYVPITSIDLMRSRAAETQQFAGSDDAVFMSGGTGKPPLSATVTVYRLTQGQRFAYTGTARWSEYNPGSQMWTKMPHTMLAKCAEALALRKAFPQELAGLYGQEEMEQAAVDAAPTRINPHITRPEDIVDVPALESPDRLPDGDQSIKALPKKNARADFSAFQQELNATKTIAELEEWGRRQADRLQTYPEDWRDIARGLYVQHKTALSQNEQGAVATSDVSDDVPEGPQEFIKWADALLATVTELHMLEKTWDFKIEPHQDKFLPPEWGDVLEVFRRHEARLAR
jgi:phage recombination protein Bet